MGVQSFRIVEEPCLIKNLTPPTTQFETPPPEKTLWGFQQAGKKEGGLSVIPTRNFARLLCAEGAVGWEAVRPCVSKEAKFAKIVSLIEKIFCARPLKEKEIFAGFACSASGGASRWGGVLPVRAEIVAQKRFALRSVIATKKDLPDFLRDSLRYTSGINQRSSSAKVALMKMVKF